MNQSSKNTRSVSSHSLSEKLSFGKRLVELWQDFQHDQNWKYEELSPAQLLENLRLLKYSRNRDEFARANWFWSRRPRLLTVASYIVWLLVALGLPFWLFIVPSIGVPFIIISAMIVNTQIVRSVWWRRQYELSIDRLIRISTNGRDTLGTDVLA
jgi:hypothetical protein